MCCSIRAQAPPPQIVQAAPSLDTDEVLVAARDLPMGTLIADADVSLAEMAEAVAVGSDDQEIRGSAGRWKTPKAR